MRTAVSVALVVLAAGVAQAEPSLERGTYLVEGVAGCGNCHTPMGPNGAMYDTLMGEDGVGQYSAAELDSMIRHGPPLPFGG